MHLWSLCCCCCVNTAAASTLASDLLHVVHGEDAAHTAHRPTPTHTSAPDLVAHIGLTLLAAGFSAVGNCHLPQSQFPHPYGVLVRGQCCCRSERGGRQGRGSRGSWQTSDAMKLSKQVTGSSPERSGWCYRASGAQRLGGNGFSRGCAEENPASGSTRHGSGEGSISLGKRRGEVSSKQLQDLLWSQILPCTSAGSSRQ